MKRSTNLFYTVGSDTNFIMFSNYGESLTGNFLSVNTKLFPSHFLCLDIPILYTKITKEDLDKEGLDVEKLPPIPTRETFIKYIAAYYENKLAFLRDKCIEHDDGAEKKLKPLYYLLEAIEKWCLKNKEYIEKFCEQDSEKFSITHVGDITEQNYNGTYTDIICVINASEHYPAEIKSSSDGTDDKEEYDSSQTYLYGWSVKGADNEIYQGPTDYENIAPEFDITPDNSTTKYYYKYNTNIIGLTKQSKNTDDTKQSKNTDDAKQSENTDDAKQSESENDLKFNIIIPLYDVINIDSNSNTSILAESNPLIGTYMQNVPLGIWFSGKEPIVLSRTDTEYDPSWSLLLSSQFKPFPYSKKSPTEIDSSDKTLAFNTFAEVATRQNKIIDKFEDLSNENIKLKKEHQDILSRLKSIGTIDNIDDLCKQITDLKTDLYAKINSLETQINGLENQINSLGTQMAELKK